MLPELHDILLKTYFTQKKVLSINKCHLFYILTYIQNSLTNMLLSRQFLINNFSKFVIKKLN